MLVADTIKQAERKKSKKEVLRKNKETKHCSRYLIKGRNNRAISLVKHSGLSHKLTREEHRHINHKTKKFMAIYKALQPRDDIDILYVTRK